MLGTVLWFDKEKGYGFIDYHNEEVFLHYSEIQKDGYKKVNPEDIVEFELRKTKNGYRAYNVRIIKETTK